MLYESVALLLLTALSYLAVLFTRFLPKTSTMWSALRHVASEVNPIQRFARRFACGPQFDEIDSLALLAYASRLAARPTELMAAPAVGPIALPAAPAAAAAAAPAAVAAEGIAPEPIPAVNNVALPARPILRIALVGVPHAGKSALLRALAMLFGAPVCVVVSDDGVHGTWAEQHLEIVRGAWTLVVTDTVGIESEADADLVGARALGVAGALTRPEYLGPQSHHVAGAPVAADLVVIVAPRNLTEEQHALTRRCKASCASLGVRHEVWVTKKDVQLDADSADYRTLIHDKQVLPIASYVMEDAHPPLDWCDTNRALLWNLKVALKKMAAQQPVTAAELSNTRERALAHVEAVEQKRAVEANYNLGPDVDAPAAAVAPRGASAAAAAGAGAGAAARAGAGPRSRPSARKQQPKARAAPAAVQFAAAAPADGAAAKTRPVIAAAHVPTATVSRAHTRRATAPHPPAKPEPVRAQPVVQSQPQQPPPQPVAQPPLQPAVAVQPQPQQPPQ